MKYKIFKPEAIHEIGQRENQEDSIFPALGQTSTDDRLFILCDGMGGHSKGEVASQTVCAALSEYILEHFPADQVFTDEMFMEALAAAYRALDEKDDGALKKMGCTLTFLYLHRGGATVAHIGDSRVYHLRPETSEILYRTRDHSLVYDLFEVGELSLAELATAPNKNIITRVMQPLQEQPCRADVVHITDIRPGDYFYLCSDGMLEIMSDNELLSILGDEDLTAQGKTKRLVASTFNNADNHSALIVHIEDVENEEGFAFEDTEKAMRQRNRVLLAELDPSLAAATKAPSFDDNAMIPPSYEQQAASNSADLSEGGDLDVPEQYDEYGNVEGEVEIVQQAEPMGNMGMNTMRPQKKMSSMTYLIIALFAAMVLGAIAFFLFFSGKNDNKEKERQEIQRDVKERSSARERREARERDNDKDDESETTSQYKHNKGISEIESHKQESRSSTPQRNVQPAPTQKSTPKANANKSSDNSTKKAERDITNIMKNGQADAGKKEQAKPNGEDLIQKKKDSQNKDKKTDPKKKMESIVQDIND